MNEIELRAQASQKTRERFEGKPFDWKTSGDCIHMFRHHAAQMGHQLPIVPRYRTPLGARKALKSMGHNDLPSLLDSMFDRWPSPAFARTGDVVAAPGCDGFHGLMIRVGITKFLGWHEEAEGCALIDVDLSQVVGAWRL